MVGMSMACVVEDLLFFWMNEREREGFPKEIKNKMATLKAKRGKPEASIVVEIELLFETFRIIAELFIMVGMSMACVVEDL
jgi:hypothetical protein